MRKIINFSIVFTCLTNLFLLKYNHSINEDLDQYFLMSTEGSHTKFQKLYDTHLDVQKFTSRWYPQLVQPILDSMLAYIDEANIPEFTNKSQFEKLEMTLISMDPKHLLLQPYSLISMRKQNHNIFHSNRLNTKYKQLLKRRLLFYFYYDPTSNITILYKYSLKEIIDPIENCRKAIISSNASIGYHDLSIDGKYFVTSESINVRVHNNKIIDNKLELIKYNNWRKKDSIIVDITIM